ncbi:MAG TPA: glycosyltransferase family 39 protein [Ktedonobacteraceae bacterium]|jgi:hypothetical protein|nr:glycosyltransferase family 39 protein [Ktedonobacteraceae bacterium]
MHLFTNSSDNTSSTVPPAGERVEGTAGLQDMDITQADSPSQSSSVMEVVSDNRPGKDKSPWRPWYDALKAILPVYIAIHLAIFVIDCLAFLFTVKDFSPQGLPISTLWEQWHYWDTAYYSHIARFGYYELHVAGFFPLYPLLERAFMFVTQDSLTAGLLVSNIAELFMFTALYRLVKEDFDGDRAYLTVLYFAIFPSAFFFSAAYTESLFLCLSILSFYYMRRGRWLLSGLFGLLASLTRPDGMFLLAPFCYEYLRRLWMLRGETIQSRFTKEQLVRLAKGLRLNILFGLCIPAGIAIYAAYCYIHFHDPLAFVHAHADWGRTLRIPGWGILMAIREMRHSGFLSFLTMRTSIDLGSDLLVFILIVSMFIGPWRLPARMWSYGIYAAVIYLYLQLFPIANTGYPLESMARFVLEIFPAFIMLANIGKYRTLHLSYCMVSGAIFFFLLAQFLTGHWVV